MKKLIVLLLASSVLIAGCKKNPSVRVANQSHGTATVTLTPTSGSTITISNVDTLGTTGFQDIDPATYVIHAGIQGVVTSPTDTSYNFAQDFNYTITITTSDAVSVSHIRVDAAAK